DLLSVVEAPRDHQVHLHGRDGANDAVRLARAGSRRRQPRRRRGALLRLGIRPVVEILLPPAARRQAADVRALAVPAGQTPLGEVAILIPLVVLLGDPEVDEGAVPDVCEAHDWRMLTLVQDRA